MTKRILCGIGIFFLMLPSPGFTAEEVEIDLDSLEEAPKEKDAVRTEEALLPVVVPTEIEKDPRWMLAALGLLVPTAAMLFPVRGRKSRREDHSDGSKASPKKEK